MVSAWPAVSYDEWRATCDTLHAHTQVLGKLAAELAPPEPQLQHTALRLTARGWETAPLPAPDGSGALVVALDLHRHEAVVEHSDGSSDRVALTPDRAVGKVTREVLAAVGRLGGPVRSTRRRRRCPGACRWTTTPSTRTTTRTRSPLLRRRDPGRAGPGRLPGALPRALHAGQRVVGLVRPGRELVLRRPGRPALARLHHAQRDGLPGGRRRLVARRHPLLQGGVLRLRPPRPGRLCGRCPCRRPRRTGMRRWGSTSWTGTTSGRSPDPHAAALEFARSAFRQACVACGWDTTLAATAEGTPPPVR